VWGGGAVQRPPGRSVFNAEICANPHVP
jgi:hypothetical protein